MSEKFSLEKKIDEIRKLVERMQKGVDDFDEQIKLYQRGTELIHICREFLDQAQMEIKQLTDDSMENFEMPEDDSSE